MASATIEEIKRLACETFSCAIEQLSEDSGPGSVPRWDSLGHIQLLEAIADTFAVDIPIEEAVEADTIAALARLVESAKRR